MRLVSSIMATSSFEDSDDSGTAISFCVCTELLDVGCNTQPDSRHSISFSPCSQACLFYGGNSGGIDFIAKHKPDNSCTRSVTLNSEKDSFLRFLVS